MLSDVLIDWGAVEVTPMEVYTDIFKLGDGYLQKENEPPGLFKANPIAYWKNEKDSKGHFRIMFEDTFEDNLKELQRADFAILNGITYFGRKNVQNHASKMYALIFDLDDVTDDTLNNFLSGAYRAKYYPVPQYVVMSGHGVHLYYVFEEPVPLFPNIKVQLKSLKYGLTDRIWNQYTSKEKKPQHQGINQGFRVIGGKTKEDVSFPQSRAFRLDTHPVTLSHLCEFVPEQMVVDEEKLFKESKLSLAEAKKKYPDWYEKVVLNKDRKPKKWDIAGKVNGDNPYALYDWWLRQIEKGATYGKRYFCIMCLAIYGIKNDVPLDRVREDAYALIPFMNELRPDEPFTKNDVDVALECFDEKYCTFPRKDIEKISGIQITPNKRNGRERKQHVKIMNAIRDIVYPEGEWRDGNGRKQKGNVVKLWRSVHPDGKKIDCARETGLHINTVYKWWD